MQVTMRSENHIGYVTLSNPGGAALKLPWPAACALWRLMRALA